MDKRQTAQNTRNSSRWGQQCYGEAPATLVSSTHEVVNNSSDKNKHVHLHRGYSTFLLTSAQPNRYYLVTMVLIFGIMATNVQCHSVQDNCRN